MGIRETQKLETKRSIQAAITKLSEIHGIENLKVRDICKEAGISIGTFYNYYSSIEAILIGVIKESNETAFEELSAVLVDEDELKNFETFISYEVDHFNNVPTPLLREIFKIFLYYPEEAILDFNRKGFDLIYQMIVRGQEKGQITNVMEAKPMSKMVLKLLIGNCFLNSLHEERFDFKKQVIDEVEALIKKRVK